MLEAFGGLLGGLGLFFVGMRMLTENLKVLTTRRVRRIAVSWVPNRYAAWGWGILSGTVIQSMAAMTFIAISMVRANLISGERALAFILGGNVGVSLLVVLVSLDIQLAALFILGAASVLVVSERAIKFRDIGGALFGLALLFVGLGLVKQSAAALAGQGVFDEFLEVAGVSLWVTFLGAAVLCFAVQSAAAVMVFVVGLSSVGILTADQTIMAIYGSFAGSSITVLALSSKQTGEARRVAMCQAFYNPVVIAVCVSMLYVELWTGVPLIKALVLAVPLDQPLSALPLISDFLLAIPVVLALPKVARLLNRLWPATAMELMSRSAYIHDRGHSEVATALELIALEQRRVLSAFSSYLDAVRQGSGIESLRNSVRTLIGDTDEFLSEVMLRHPGHRVDDLSSMLAQQRLIGWLEEQFAELCDSLNRLPSDESGARLRGTMVEGIDAAVLTIIDGLGSNNPEDWATAKQLTDDRSLVLRQLRSSYMPQDGSPATSEAAQATIVRVTNTAGEIFFLLFRLTREVENSPRRDHPARGNS